MKKLMVFCLALFISGVMSDTFAQDRAIKNGFMINFAYGMPNSYYGSHPDVKVDSEMTFVMIDFMIILQLRYVLIR